MEVPGEVEPPNAFQQRPALLALATVPSELKVNCCEVGGGAPHADMLRPPPPASVTHCPAPPRTEPSAATVRLSGAPAAPETQGCSESVACDAARAAQP